jgi:hypothetical protein
MKRGGSSPLKSDLLNHDAIGRFVPEVQHLLLRDLGLPGEVVSLVLNNHFPDSIRFRSRFLMFEVPSRIRISFGGTVKKFFTCLLEIGLLSSRYFRVNPWKAIVRNLTQRGKERKAEFGI